MEHQEIFEYTYCPRKSSEVLRIREAYLPGAFRREGILDRLRSLLRTLIPAVKS